jgi:hypothetical protein
MCVVAEGLVELRAVSQRSVDLDRLLRAITGIDVGLLGKSRETGASGN